MFKATPTMIRAKALIRQIEYEASGQFLFETRKGVRMSMKIMEPVGIKDYEEYPLILSANAHDEDGGPIPETLEMMIMDDQPVLIEALAYSVRNAMRRRTESMDELPELLAEMNALMALREEKPPAPVDSKWKLVSEDGIAFVLGDMCEDPDGDRYEIVGFHPPRKPESTGKVEVTNENGFTQLYYPSVVGLKYVEVSAR